ncbi:MAG: methylmalonyl-CoA epimerase [Candidatus Melainabacteria bacterium]|nr:MAG: methylmalonyl-CoA epimerase [Candidatus Melainabacteria bacterium]
MSQARLDHIAIAVANLEEAMHFYLDALGLALDSTEVVEEQGVRLAKLAVGDTHIELLEPLSEETPVGKFLIQRGPGLHHLCLGVNNIQEQLAALKSRGIRLIDATPRRGAGGAKIAFIHPKAAGGTLIELSEQHSE